MNPTTRPRVALVQTHWRPDPAANLQTVLDLIETIPDPVHLITLPEFFLGPPWYFPGQAHLRDAVEQTIPGPLTDRLAEVAVSRDCYVLAGTLVERERGCSYNTSALIDPSGKVVAKARKVHRFSAELLSIEAGDERVIVDTPFGRLGILVCSDFWILEMPRLLALAGAEIMAVPGAALVSNLPITKPCLQANSSHNVCYTVFTSLVGSVTGERGGRTVSIQVGGHSTVAGPEHLLASLEGEEVVLTAELDMDYLRVSRTVDLSFKRSLYWCLHGRRPELYGDLGEHFVEHSDLASLLGRYLT